MESWDGRCYIRLQPRDYLEIPAALFRQNISRFLHQPTSPLHYKEANLWTPAAEPVSMYPEAAELMSTLPPGSGARY